MNELTIVYPTNDAAIAELAKQAVGLTADTKDGYEKCRLAIGTCRTLRSEIEKKRVALKADALAWGKRVDGEAKRLTGLIEAIEEPIKAAKQKVDDAAALAKRQKEEAERLAAEAKAKAAREAEEARLAAEREKLAAERKELDDARAAEEAKNKAFQDKLESERKAIEIERQSLEQAKLLAERKRAAAEKPAASPPLCRPAARMIGKEARLDDKRKLAAFAAELRRVYVPKMNEKPAVDLMAVIESTIAEIATRCETYGQ